MGKISGKADQILRQVQRLGVCVEEGDDLREAARAFDDAQQAGRAARKSVGGGWLAMLGGAVTLGGCVFAGTGVGAAICVGGGALGYAGGFLSAVGDDDAREVADAQLDDATQDLNAAMAAICACIARYE